ncbi:phosphotransferase family protein [Salisediminibacterium halotolerans]|uniref:phosphotransferase family protein n=1 Tax=Salisediminibacterium halotolerans TaxID=517425 RepID=UPI000EB13D0D|nr:phosphotransferase [Salisediminibacterium halotolerans]RLJ75724.1 phosphotransferase family enzyme [Actinophytocola xinjiangensis]RPE89578.1 phosphotransferase family enzyme [Salisediminibacterium halotolerans]TWG36337.1 phosphotransferase family enzyme [Salisediminibacterium halotolerans]GEL07214.1 hypothetical protein SHA02_06300 [Salisediminibacterium halotolerans]
MLIFYRFKRIVKEEGYLKLIEKFFNKLAIIDFNPEFRRFNKLYEQDKWEEAIELAYGFKKRTYQNYEFVNKLGVCHFKIGERETANSIMKTGFEMEMNCKMEEVIQKIDFNILEQMPAIENLISTYRFNGGKRNLGLIEHEYTQGDETRQLITKVTTNVSEEHKRFLKEVFFYNDIREQYPQLKAITPNMVCSGAIDGTNLNFMTLTKIHGRPSKKTDLNHVLEIDAVIKSIQGEAIKKQIENAVSKDDLSLSAHLHKISTHSEIFSILHKKVREHNSFQDLADAVKRLEDVMSGSKLYEKIDLDSHYVFCHGDYNTGNFIFDDSRPYIIDWAEYRIDFVDADLANYFFKFNYTFKEIEDTYLRSIENQTEENLIRRVFFVYILIFKWLTRMVYEEAEQTAAQKIEPAVLYIENALDIPNYETKEQAVCST